MEIETPGGEQCEEQSNDNGNTLGNSKFLSLD